MLTVLLTNDDGIDSPTLVPLARAMSPIGPLRIIAPSAERSWIAKAITRFDSIRVFAETRDGVDIQAVTGTPADCVSLGVHTLYPTRPDAVVSGINLGLNYGSAFLLSSGTVGAAIESCLSGVPSIAFSMAVPQDAYGLRGAHRIEVLGQRALPAAAVAADITAAILRHGFPPGVDCFSVNMPADVSPETPRVVARVTRAAYGPLFVPDAEGGYRHRFQGYTALEALADGDMEIVQRGAIAIAPIRLDLSATVPHSLATALASGKTSSLQQDR